MPFYNRLRSYTKILYQQPSILNHSFSIKVKINKMYELLELLWKLLRLKDIRQRDKEMERLF